MEYVHDLRQKHQMNEFIGYCNHGEFMDAALVRQSMTLFAKDVMSPCR